jgi:GxxExxY protein
LYYPDIIVNNVVILELKASEILLEENELQLLNYLKATEIEIGLLLNFGKKPEIRRKIFTNDNKKLKIK